MCDYLVFSSMHDRILLTSPKRKTLFMNLIVFKEELMDSDTFNKKNVFFSYSQVDG